MEPELCEDPPARTAKASRTQWVHWPNLGAGVYYVTATLTGPGGRVLAVARQRAVAQGTAAQEPQSPQTTRE